MLSITIESPMQDDVRALIAKSDAYSAERYPEEARFGSPLDALAKANVRFHVARLGELAVGCAALVIGPDGAGELKRMFVDDAARGQGAGRGLLRAIEETAASEGISLIQLETGPFNTEALALYQRGGFAECGPFGEYAAHPMSIFMEKSLPVG